MPAEVSRYPEMDGENSFRYQVAYHTRILLDDVSWAPLQIMLLISLGPRAALCLFLPGVVVDPGPIASNRGLQGPFWKCQQLSDILS